MTHAPNLKAVKADPAPNAPLRGLDALAKVALLGRQRILDAAKRPVVWTWQDVVVEATIAMLAGGPGEGKTTLLFLILVARLNLGEAVYLLGRRVVPAPEGKFVVLIEGEHPEESTSRKLVRSCRLLRVHDACLERIIIVARKGVLIGSPEWADVERLIAAGLVSDLALDTLARVAPSDANDERAQVEIFNRIARAIDRAPSGERPTAWILAHTRKGADGGLDDVSGSAQRTGQADTVLMVKGERVEGRIVSSRVTFAKLREDPEEYPRPVTFSILGGPDGEHLSSECFDAAKDARPLEAQIEALLAVEARTLSSIAALTKRSRADVNKAISNLFEARRIQTTAITVKGIERKAFALRAPYENTGRKHRTTPLDRTTPDDAGRFFEEEA